MNRIYLDLKPHLLFLCLLAALSDPLGVLIPPVFPVGTKYTFQCETPLIGYTNTTLSVYDRLLPLRSGNNSFEYVGSRVLAPGEWGAAITRTNAGETYEFLCEMEVFLNGRALRSRSKPTAAMPGTDRAPNQTASQYNSLMYF